MADYLKIAASRVLGRGAPAIQPRIPSLFEPPGPPGLPASARFTRFAATPANPEPEQSFAGERSVETSQERTPEVQASLPARRPTRHEVLPDPVKHIPEQRLETKGVAANVVHWKSHSTHPVPGLERQEEIFTPAVTAASRRPAVTARNTSDEAAPPAPTRIEPRHPDNPGLPERREFKQEIQSKTVERHVEQSVVKEVVERVKWIQAENAPIRRADTHTGTVRAVALSQQATFSHVEPGEDSRPVINVVIGRVSVNAVTERPAVVPRPVQPPGPTLTLDRYLEQRKGRS